MERDDLRARAEALAAGIDESAHPFAVDLAVEVLWQRSKLEEARKTIDSKRMKMAVSYDNGGGQKGTHKNPMFDAYNAAFRGYVSGITALDAMLAKERQGEIKRSGKLAQLRLVSGDPGRKAV